MQNKVITTLLLLSLSTMSFMEVFGMERYTLEIHDKESCMRLELPKNRLRVTSDQGRWGIDYREFYGLLDTIEHRDICEIVISLDYFFDYKRDEVLREFEKAIDTLQHFKHFEKLTIMITSPNQSDSVYFRKIFDNIPNREIIKSVYVGYSVIVPDQLPELPNVENVSIGNWYDSHMMAIDPDIDEMSFWEWEDVVDSAALQLIYERYNPPSFPTGLFRSFTNAKNVSLKFSILDTLMPDHVFSGYENLEDLRLGRNGFKKLPVSLTKLPKLEFINITYCDNFIDLFDPKLDFTLSSLKFLFMGDRDDYLVYDTSESNVYRQYSPCYNISKWPIQFDNFPEIVEVSVHFPNVKNIEPDLGYVATLERFFFIDAFNLRSIPKICTQAETLHISISNAKALKNISNITRCSKIDRLGISEFDTGLLWDHILAVVPESNIKRLGLDFNSVKHLSAEDFKKLNALQEIRIYNSPIRWIEEIKNVLPDTNIRN